MALSPKQKEVAARALCRMRGIDPEAYTARDSSCGHAEMYVPHWRVCLEEIEAREQLDEAMTVGAQSCES